LRRQRDLGHARHVRWQGSGLHTAVTCRQLSRRRTSASSGSVPRRCYIDCRKHTLTQDGIGSIQEFAAVRAHRLPRYIAHYLRNRLDTHRNAGDMNTLFAARAEARKNFDSNRNLAPGSEELSKQITHAEEVAKFLRENVVQGQAAGEDNYSMSLHFGMS
jgi:hypothetical protein